MIRSRMSRRILAWISLAGALTLLGALGVIEYVTHNDRLDDLRVEQRLMTEGQAILLSDLLSADDEILVLSALSGALSDPDIVGVALRDAEGDALYEFGDLAQPGAIVASEPITGFLDGELVVLGELSTYASDRRIVENAIDRLSRMALMVGSVLIAVILATMWALHRVVGRPLGMMVDAIRQDEGGPRVVDWRSEDEVGIVVREFNALQEAQHRRIGGLRDELSARERREAERMRSLVDAASEGLAICADGVVIDVNDAMAAISGLEREAMIGEPAARWLPAELVDGDLARGARKAQGEIEGGKGAVVAVEMIARPIDHLGRAARVVAVRDITDRLAAEARIRHMALHDALTDLPNRRAFQQRLRAELDAESGYGFSLLAIDLDGFKKINDDCGHAAGDELLVAVARRLAAMARAEDLAARLGGDEFVMLRRIERDCDEGDVAIAERIVAKLAAPFELACGRRVIGASVGVARHPEHAVTETALMHAADAALYEAKAAGRNTYRVAACAARRSLVAQGVD